MKFSTVTYKDEPTLSDLKTCRDWVKKLKVLSTQTSRGYNTIRNGVDITHFKKAYKQELKNLQRLERRFK